MAPYKEEKVTVMILEVDLKCSCCYKKVKKLLCKFPQIRDQAFDEDKNKVTIKVVCCDPEKMRDRLCCKGGNAIRSTEIVENKPPKPPTKPDPPPPTKPDPKPPPKLDPKPDPKPPPKPDPPHPPVSGCCQECSNGHGGGPCHYGYGRPVPPPPPPPPGPCYNGYGYGYCYGYQYIGNRPCYVSRCDYFCEDNPQGCSIM